MTPLTNPEKPPTSRIPPPQYRRIVWSLAVAETLLWATTYYMFPALLLTWERELGWSKTELSGAFTIAVLVSALLAPSVGRIIDKGYSTRIFTGSALLAAIAVLALSVIGSLWQFYGVWVVLGVAMSGSLYEACFAVLTKTMGEQRKQAITLVTLVAGFAGTLSFPGNNALVNLVGWRGTMWVLAGIIAGIAVPLIWIGCRAADNYNTPPVRPTITKQSTNPTSVTRNPIFWLLAVGFATIALNHGVLLTHLLPLLDERGTASGTAVFAASMIGPMQVAGRLTMLFFERRASSLTIFIFCFVTIIFASMLLLAANTFPVLVMGFVLFQGAGYGVTSILRPVITADLLGYKNFGLTSGLLAMPFQGSAAAAATIAALIWGVGGYDLVIWFAIGVALFGVVLLGIAGIFANQQSVSNSTQF